GCVAGGVGSGRVPTGAGGDTWSTRQVQVSWMPLQTSSAKGWTLGFESSQSQAEGSGQHSGLPWRSKYPSRSLSCVSGGHRLQTAVVERPTSAVSNPPSKTSE